ncbi:MAG: hypothetical protein EOM59_12375 [Clostridia bacterium]|nr:hypothetical protein [Clostridia bacterium]
MLVKKVISGGQTGVDRAGLDAAIELGIEHGGYAPKGRKAEDGQIPAKYNLEELTRGGYPTRTKKNIKSSDGTVIFCQGKPSTGTKLTVDYAKAMKKPCLVLDLDAVIVPTAVERIREWIARENIQILNVAGPRLSSAPVVATMAKKILLTALRG